MTFLGNCIILCYLSVVLPCLSKYRSFVIQLSHIQRLDEELTVATEAYLESERCTVCVARREVGRRKYVVIYAHDIDVVGAMVQ